MFPCGKTRVGSWLISGSVRVISGPLMNESCSIRGGIDILLWMACLMLMRIAIDVPSTHDEATDEPHWHYGPLMVISGPVMRFIYGPLMRWFSDRVIA